MAINLESEQRRTGILNPPKTLRPLSACGRKDRIYLRISGITIKYNEMEGTYASLPESTRHTLIGDSYTSSAEKVYAASILASQTSASQISRHCTTSTHLPQWPISNDSRYAPVAHTWFLKLAALLDAVLSSTECSDARFEELFASLEVEQVKVDRVQQILDRMVQDRFETAARIYWCDDQNMSWNNACRLIAHGETVHEAMVNIHTKNQEPTSDEFMEGSSPLNLCIDLDEVAWPVDPHSHDAWYAPPMFKDVKNARKPANVKNGISNTTAFQAQAKLDKLMEMEPVAATEHAKHATSSATGLMLASTTAIVVDDVGELTAAISKLFVAKVSKDGREFDLGLQRALEAKYREYRRLYDLEAAALLAKATTKEGTGDGREQVLVHVHEQTAQSRGQHNEEPKPTSASQQTRPSSTPAMQNAPQPTTKPEPTKPAAGIPSTGQNKDTATANLAPAANLQAYNEKWDSLGPKDLDFPFPSPTLTRAGFLVVDNIHSPDAIKGQWSVPIRISVNTKVFFLNGFGLAYSIRPKIYSSPQDTQIVRLTTNNGVDDVKKLVRHIKLKEMSRWHPDRLNKRTGNEAAVDETQGAVKGVVEVRTAVQELLAECEEFLVQVEHEQLKAKEREEQKTAFGDGRGQQAGGRGGRGNQGGGRGQQGGGRGRRGGWGQGRGRW